MKPDYITDTDWQLLREKYPNRMDYVLKKLNEDYPVQYLIGSVPFLNTEIKVDNRALIPRFETEYLVSKIIDKFKIIGCQKTPSPLTHTMMKMEKK